MRTIAKPRDLTRASIRYMDTFLGMRCSIDLISLSLFPNMKEVTESFGAFEAVRKNLKHVGLDVSDPTVSVVCVGDGRTPRTAATFAFRTRWTAYSVDPILKSKRLEKHIDRLVCLPRKAETEDLHLSGPVIVVAVHSHAPLWQSVERIKCPEGQPRLIVAMPCCVHQVMDRDPDLEYEDEGVWSPARRMKVWLHRPDSNRRPSGYEPDELPSAPRCDHIVTEGVHHR